MTAYRLIGSSPAGVDLAVCLGCGVVVGDRERHNTACFGEALDTAVDEHAEQRPPKLTVEDVPTGELL